MAGVGSVTVYFNADTGKFETDINRATRLANQKSREISASVIAIGTAMGNFISGAVEAVGRLVENTVHSSIELAHLAEKTGLSAQALGGLRLAAAESGVDMDRLGKTLTKVAGIQFDAATGSKKAAAEMRFFGITAKDTADTAVDKLIKGFEAMPPSFDRAGLAVKIFGQRLGTDFLLVADKSKDGLAALEKQAADLGIALDDKTFKAAEQFEKSMAIVRLQVQSIGETILVAVLPIINDFVKALSDPAIAAEFKDIAQIAIESFGLVIEWAGKASSAVANVARDGAALQYGAASDDAPRLKEENARITARLARIQAITSNPSSLSFDRILAPLQSDPLATQQTGSLVVPLKQEEQILSARLAQNQKFQSQMGAQAKAAADAAAAAAKVAADASTAASAAGAKSQADYEKLIETLGKSEHAHGGHAKAVKKNTDAMKDAIKAQEELWKELQKDQEAGKAAADDLQSILVEQRDALESLADRSGRKYHERLDQIKNDQVAMSESGRLTAQATKDIALATERATTAYEAEAKAIRAANAEQNNFIDGAKRAVTDYMHEAEQVGTLANQAFGNAFRGMEDALVRFVTTGKLNFKSLAASILADLARIEIKILLSKVLQMFLPGGDAASQQVGAGGGGYGTDFSPFGNATGNAFSGGNVIPFARGDVFSSPTLFPMSGGRTGMLGEAGPEAIVPLSRGRDGKLGIQSSGGSGVGAVNITVVVDNSGGSTSKTTGDDAAQGRQMGEALRAVVVKELVYQQRPGGMLYKLGRAA
jgi:lambda family phage tail tape measure protein